MKSFKKHLESYGMGGVSIGSLDSYRPMASLGSTDRPPQPSADQRATTAVKPQTKVKKKKTRYTEIEDVNKNTALYNHLKEKGLISEKSPFKKKIMDKISKPIKDYLKKKKTKN